MDVKHHGYEPLTANKFNISKEKLKNSPGSFNRTQALGSLKCNKINSIKYHY